MDDKNLEFITEWLEQIAKIQCASAISPMFILLFLFMWLLFFFVSLPPFFNWHSPIEMKLTIKLLADIYKERERGVERKRESSPPSRKPFHSTVCFLQGKKPTKKLLLSVCLMEIYDIFHLNGLHCFLRTFRFWLLLLLLNKSNFTLLPLNYFVWVVIYTYIFANTHAHTHFVIHNIFGIRIKCTHKCTHTYIYPLLSAKINLN